MSTTNSTIGQNLLHQMPQPIASAWSLLLRAEDASEKIRLCWGVIDIFLRYTTAITLSHYLRGESSPNVERLLPYLRRPSFGHYCAIIREALRNSDAGEAHFLNHIHSWYFTEEGAPSSAAKELDYFIAMRNRDTHHGSRTSDELDGVIESLVDEIQLFLHKAKWLSGYSLYSFSSPNMRRKGGFSGQSFRYHGQNINPLPKSKQWSCRLFPETVYICNPEGTQFLEISPLLILESNRHNTFYLFSSTPKGLRLDSRCTITETSKQFVPKIHNLDVSWDEFVSKRQELDPIAHNSESTFFRIDSFFEIGMVINNRYKIKSRIGSGGMAVVFHAEDQFLEREVALKILHIEQVDSVNRNRAIKEFLRMTELNHPNIVSVYESVNLADNRVAVSMPLYQGSIKDLFHVKKPKIEQVEAWAEQILNALDYLHDQEQTIIHRDIKPSNIFIDKEGNALLGDFGIARKEGDARLTKTSEQIGSQAYMSPEQKQGISEPHNDLYSLGITLHEIITGDLPKIPGEGIDGDLGILITMLTSDNIEDRMNASWPLPSREEGPLEEPSEEEIIEEEDERDLEPLIEEFNEPFDEEEKEVSDIAKDEIESHEDEHHNEGEEASEEEVEEIAEEEGEDSEEEVRKQDEGLLQDGSEQTAPMQNKHLEQQEETVQEKSNEQLVETQEQEIPVENKPNTAEYVENTVSKEKKESTPIPENLGEP